jgi:NodT family efflux transporter outer membrane factor (OMF) lipoprotein
MVLLLMPFGAIAADPAMPKALVAVPDRFQHQLAGVNAGSHSQWWKLFGDPLLDSLIERAGRTNLDLRIAGARLAESRALRGESKSALLPAVDGTASATHLRGGFNQGVTRIPNAAGALPSGSLVAPFETSVVSAGFTSRWEIDLFGGLRKQLRAANADVQAAAENIADVRTVMQAEVARNYIELRGAEEQAAIVRANIEAEREMLELIQVRADAGLASDLDVERQLAQLSAVQAALPDLDMERLRAAHRIAVLLAEEPGALLVELDRPSSALAVPAVPAAVPSDVLKQRPDIRRAEAEITAAFARAGAARAELYPKLVITGLTGRQATDFGGLTIGAGNFFSVGPGITLPIFHAGRIRANIAAQDARLEQAVRRYESEVLAAFEETENAFVSRDRAELKRKELDTGVRAAIRSIELAQELYVRGLADFLTVLDAQRQRFLIERDLAASRTAVLRGSVALYKALGE